MPADLAGDISRRGESAVIHDLGADHQKQQGRCMESAVTGRRTATSEPPSTGLRAVSMRR